MNNLLLQQLLPDSVHSFKVFAEHMNFTKAANQLHIAQPSLHAKITKLSNILGVPLYEKEKNKLYLTSYGQKLALYASDIEKNAYDFLSTLEQTVNKFTISAGRGALLWVLPDILKKLKRENQSIKIIPNTNRASIKILEQGLSDAAVLAYDLPPDRFKKLEIATYSQCLLINKEHKLAEEDFIKINDLDGIDLIVPSEGQPHRNTLDRLKNGHITWNKSAEVDGWDLSAKLVQLNYGSAVVNGCVKPPSLTRLLPILDLPKVTYWLVWREQREDSVKQIKDIIIRWRKDLQD